jgi:hypothetical protein
MRIRNRARFAIAYWPKQAGAPAVRRHYGARLAGPVLSRARNRKGGGQKRGRSNARAQLIAAKPEVQAYGHDRGRRARRLRSRNARRRRRPSCPQHDRNQARRLDGPRRRLLVTKLALPQREVLRIQAPGPAICGLALPGMRLRLQVLSPPGSNIFPPPRRRQPRRVHSSPPSYLPGVNCRLSCPGREYAD